MGLAFSLCPLEIVTIVCHTFVLMYGKGPGDKELFELAADSQFGVVMVTEKSKHFYE